MINNVKDSSIYIAIMNQKKEFDECDKSQIQLIFDDIFNNSCSKVLETEESHSFELIYEIKTPIIKNEVIMRDFYVKLEELFFRLEDYKPHFTQLQRGGR